MNRYLRLWQTALPKTLFSLIALSLAMFALGLLSATAFAQESKTSTPSPGSATVPGTGAVSPARFKATVNYNGVKPRVTFQSVSGPQEIFAYDQNGKQLGRMNWQAIFDVETDVKTLNAAITEQGIDLDKLLKNVRGSSITDSAGSSDKLIKANLPFEIKGEDGTKIAVGNSLYFKLSDILVHRKIAPAGASAAGMKYGRNFSNSPAVKAANAFNSTLAEKGVVGSPKGVQPEDGAGQAAGDSSVHPGMPNTPLIEQPSNSESGPLWSDKFMSPPTCGCLGNGCRMTSHFGHRRTFRNSNGRMASTYHPGMDIGGGKGTEVRAVADGCVSRQLTSRSASWGLTVYLDHGKDQKGKVITSQYSHMDKFAPGLEVGQCFKRGDPIGRVGATGNCTGPHLHFGVYRDRKAVNPRQYLLANSSGEFNRSCEELMAYNKSLTETIPALAAVGGSGDGTAGTVVRSTPVSELPAQFAQAADQTPRAAPRAARQ